MHALHKLIANTRLSRFTLLFYAFMLLTYRYYMCLYILRIKKCVYVKMASKSRVVYINRFVNIKFYWKQMFVSLLSIFLWGMLFNAVLLPMKCVTNWSLRRDKFSKNAWESSRHQGCTLDFDNVCTFVHFINSFTQIFVMRTV